METQAGGWNIYQTTFMHISFFTSGNRNKNSSTLNFKTSCYGQKADSNKKQDRAIFAMNYTMLQDPEKWVIL